MDIRGENRMIKYLSDDKYRYIREQKVYELIDIYMHNPRGDC